MQRPTVRQYIPIIGIVLLSVIFRFVYVDRIPTAISGDELHYALTAKSIWLTGHDITGTWNPLSIFLFRYPPNEQQAELPYFLHLPFSGPFPFSLFLTKLPFALLSIGIVILLYDIARKLFGRTAGLITGLIAAVNPWFVVMGRTGYESTPATFFYILALWVLLSAKSWNILWSFIPLALAFYSYIGTKLIFIPFVILTVALTYRNGKHNSFKPYGVLILSCTVLTAGYLLLLKASPAGGRIAELLLPSSPVVASHVNEIRKSFIQSPLLSLFVNKYTVYTQILFTKLFRIFSPSYMFLEGDQFFLPARQSFFYYADFLFIILGALAVYCKKRTYFFILTGFILIGTLPHLLHVTQGDFSGHLTLIFPFLILMTGAGIAACIDTLKGKSRSIALGIAVLVYTLNIANFAFVYFFQYPLAGSADFPMRILARYLTLAKNKNIPITIYSTRNGDFFTKYLFYSNVMDRQTMTDIRRADTRLPFSFNGIHFTDCNAKKQAPQGEVSIYDATCNIKPAGVNTYISKLTDGGILYTIVNDPVCSRRELNAYPTGITVTDLSVERLPELRFCTVYISR